MREASHFHRVHLLQRQAGRCAACKAVFDPDLEQGRNTNVVVRRDPATGQERLFLFNYKAVERGGTITSMITLREGDVLIVPERRLFE